MNIAVLHECLTWNSHIKDWYHYNILQHSTKQRKYSSFICCWLLTMLDKCQFRLESLYNSDMYLNRLYFLLGVPSDQSSGTSSPLCDSGLHLNYHPNNTVREWFMRLSRTWTQSKSVLTFYFTWIETYMNTIGNVFIPVLEVFSKIVNNE